ncbi:MAG: cryptochrome/photolyase family protein [Pseudomonadota bacterium]
MSRNDLPAHPEGPAVPKNVRRLCLVLGDQLDANSAIFDAFDSDQDVLLMCEAGEEASYIAQHKRRLVMFFAAMRHFAAEQAQAGRPVIYHRLDHENPPESLGAGLTQAVKALKPEAAIVVAPGDWRVRGQLIGAAEKAGARLETIEDRHFLSTPEAFAEMRKGRKRFILEDFYRAERKRTGWLMDGEGPVGGAWNFDKQNRKSFGRDGPGLIPKRKTFTPDAITMEVLAMVSNRFGNAPGSLDGFEEPVTRTDALAALDDFIDNRLVDYGDYQDAIAIGRVTLYHARISAVMNLKLISPEEACARAIKAYEKGAAPLNAVEGFVRQILGWREFVRGIYFTMMPDYADRNALDADRDVPEWFWTGETEMACLADALGGLVRTGYAHHIQRLMVMGLYQLLLGAHPYKVHEWHMSMYLDAIDWVSLPNVLGMSQHGDGGVVGTKPYAASGSYIDRMSDCCRECRFDPKQATGDKACPFTTLYWDFLDRHGARFRSNRRMALQMSNLDRKDADEMKAIRKVAAALRD